MAMLLTENQRRKLEAADLKQNGGVPSGKVISAEDLRKQRAQYKAQVAEALKNLMARCRGRMESYREAIR